MKNLLLFAGALVLSAPVLATDYSGTWVLDTARSANLPPFYSQVRSHKLTNIQDGKQLTVDIEIEPAGRPVDRFAFVYKLDGTPTSAQTEVRTQAGVQKVPTTMTAHMDEEGKVHIDIVRLVKMGDEFTHSTSTEDWSLSPDGKTLTVKLVRQNLASNLVFAKQ